VSFPGKTWWKSSHHLGRKALHTVKPIRPQMAIWRMRIAWWTSKATDTHSECHIYCFSTATTCCAVDTLVLLLLLLWFSLFSFYHACLHCMLVISLTISCLVLASLKTRHGRNIISFYFFLFITGLAKCLSREQCVWSNTCNNSCFVLQQQPAVYLQCVEQHM